MSLAAIPMIVWNWFRGRPILEYVRTTSPNSLYFWYREVWHLSLGFVLGSLWHFSLPFYLAVGFVYLIALICAEIGDIKTGAHLWKSPIDISFHMLGYILPYFIL